MKKVILIISALIFGAISLHADLTVNIPFDPNVTGPAYNDSNYTYVSEYFNVINNGVTDDFTVNVNYYEIPSGWSLGWCHEYQGSGSCHVIPWPWTFEFGSGDTLKLDFNVYVTSSGTADFFYKFTAPSLADSVLLNFSYTTGYSIDDPQMQNKIFVKNVPNPFSHSTEISFTSQINFSRLGDITIYNIKGETIKTLNIAPDMNSVTWNGTDDNGNNVPNGVYFYSTSFKDGPSITEKLLLIR